MKTIAIFSIVLLSVLTINNSKAQTTLTGRVVDKKGSGLAFVNVYLLNSYSGASTDLEGYYTFNTDLEGTQTLVFDFIGYEKKQLTIYIIKDTLKNDVVLKLSTTSIEGVTITAGAFEASDEKKTTILKPFDIVTTAGGAADLFQVMQMLPGTQRIGETEGLFVRGGNANETQTFIDGLLVQNPYFGSVPDVPQRGRFQPYLFKGTVFSSGGYSARYGKALSSALILSTEDIIDTNTTSVSLNLAGVGAYHNQKWKSSCISIGADYSNLKPYFNLDKQETDWIKPPETIRGEINYKVKPNKYDIFKIYSSYSASKLSLRYPYFYDTLLIYPVNQIDNTDLYINSSYKKLFSENTSCFVGFSMAKNQTMSSLDHIDSETKTSLIQLRTDVTHYFGDNSVVMGGEFQNVTNSYDDHSSSNKTFRDNFFSLYLESNYSLSSFISLRGGIRYEYSEALQRSNIGPRVSMAFKTGINSQISLAYGIYYQAAEDSILINYPKSDFENAHHYILNYQWMKDERSFRLEVYQKNYNNLITNFPNSTYTNNGYGYARGIDVFWRDKSTIKNLDYWISYSFLDTKRKYREYDLFIPPDFVSDHTISAICKYFFTGIGTSVSFTYLYSSGRTFVRPLQHNVYNLENTPVYHKFSISLGKLASIANQFTVFYVSIDNIFNTKFTYAYRYSSDGSQRIEIGPPNLRSIFFGCYISITN